MKSQVSLPWLWEIICLGIGLVLVLSACGPSEAAPVPPAAAPRGSVFVR
jgi:hypothetical protein